jgi:hypothetical protein
MDVRLLLATTLAAAAGVSPFGTFTTTLTVAELRAAGASSREAAWDAGTWTLVLGGNHWTLRQGGGLYGNAVDAGRRDGARFTLTSADGYAHNEYVGEIRVVAGARTLRFVSLDHPRNEDIARILTIHPWTRVR